MKDITFTPAMADRLAELLALFKLPTMATETTRRLEKDGHTAALRLLLEVAEMEAANRRDRRIDRLRRASMLPPGKTFEAFDMARLLTLYGKSPALTAQARRGDGGDRRGTARTGLEDLISKRWTSGGLGVQLRSERQQRRAWNPVGNARNRPPLPLHHAMGAALPKGLPGRRKATRPEP